MSRLPSTPMGAAAAAEYIRLADPTLATGTDITGDGVLAVPDVALVELAVNGHAMAPTLALRRHDGREVSFFWLPGRAA